MTWLNEGIKALQVQTVLPNRGALSIIKSINLNVLLHTRSEETRVKLLALSCSEALWATHAGKMLGTFVPPAQA